MNDEEFERMLHRHAQKCDDETSTWVESDPGRMARLKTVVQQTVQEEDEAFAAMLTAHAKQSAQEVEEWMEESEGLEDRLKRAVNNVLVERRAEAETAPAEAPEPGFMEKLGEWFRLPGLQLALVGGVAALAIMLVVNRSPEAIQFTLSQQARGGGDGQLAITLEPGEKTFTVKFPDSEAFSGNLGDGLSADLLGSNAVGYAVSSCTISNVTYSGSLLFRGTELKQLGELRLPDPIAGATLILKPPVDSLLPPISASFNNP